MKNIRLTLEIAATLALVVIGGMLFAGIRLLTQPSGAIEHDPYFIPVVILLVAVPLRFLVFREGDWIGMNLLFAGVQRLQDLINHRLFSTPSSLLGVAWILLLAVYLFASHPPRDAGLTLTLSPGGESDPFPDVTIVTPNVDIGSPALRRNVWWARDLRSRFKGYLYVSRTGRYPLEVYSDGHAWIRIDGAEVLVNKSFWEFVPVRADVDLKEGSHPIEVEYWDAWLNSAISLRWNIGSGMRPIPPANFGQVSMSAGDHTRRLVQSRISEITRILLILYSIVLLTYFVSQFSKNGCLDRKFTRVSLLVCIILAGTGYRIWVLWTTRGMMIADEAVVGIATLRIQKGEWPLIYYGQAYGGLFESYLAAPLFMLFGCSNLVLKMVPLILSVLLIPLVYFLGKRIFSLNAGLLAAAYIALPPVMCTIYSLMMMVGPIEIPVFGVLALLLVIRLGSGERPHWLKENLLYLLLGFILGFSFWINGQIIYYILAIAVWLFLRRRGSLFSGPVWSGAIGGIVGMIPLLIHNLRHQGETFGFLFSKDAAGGFLFTGIWDSMRSILLDRCIPAILGGTVQWKMTENLPLGPLPVLVYLLAMIIGIWALAQTLMRWRSSEQGQKVQPFDLLILFCLITPIIFSGSKFGYYSGGATGMPRYVFAAFPILAVLFGTVLCYIGRRSLLLSVILAMPVLLLHLFGNIRTDPFYYFQPVHFITLQDTMLPTENIELIRFLKESNLTDVFTDYWIGTQLVVESGEAIKVDTERDRFEPYADAARHTWHPLYMFHTNDQKARTYENLFKFMGWSRKFIPPHVLYWAPGNIPPKAQWKITSYQPGDDASKAIDGDYHLESAYISPTPKHRGMYLRIDLGEVVNADGIMLFRQVAPPEYNLKDAGPGKANVFLSMDGENYDDLRGTLEYNEATGSDLIILGPSKFRGFHISVDEDDAGHFWSVYEIFVW